MSFSTRTKKNVRNIGGVSAVALAAALLLTPVASTANFSASGGGTIHTETGKLSLGLTDGQASKGTFNLDFDLKPGEVQSDQVIVVTNTGDIAANVTFSVTKASNPKAIGAGTVSPIGGPAAVKPDAKLLTLGVHGYTSLTPYQSFKSAPLGSIEPGETKSYTIDNGLDALAGNEWQGQQVDVAALITLDQQ